MSPSQFAQMYLCDFTLNIMQFAHTSSYPSETLDIHCCHLVDTIIITTRVMARTGTFLLHFKDGGGKTIVVFFFVFSSTRYIVLYSPTCNSHFHKLQNVCFQMVPRICMSLLQGLSYRQLDLGMSFQERIEKKWTILF